MGRQVAPDDRGGGEIGAARVTRRYCGLETVHPPACGDLAFTPPRGPGRALMRHWATAAAPAAAYRAAARMAARYFIRAASILSLQATGQAELITTTR